MEMRVFRSGWLVALVCALMMLAAWPLPSAAAEEPTPFPPYRVDHTPLASAVSAGGEHTCFLLRSSVVQCQGAGSLGESRSDHAGDVAQVSAGDGHTCLLRKSGNVDCYGSNKYGEAITYTGGYAKQVSAGEDHTCILFKSGSVSCYGRNDAGQSGSFTGGDILSVSAGGRHTCVLRSGGQVECQGASNHGQSQDYTGSDARAVSAGTHHTCILLANGSVYCFGLNNEDQSQGYAGLDAVAVSAGRGHSCALRENGSVTCWGSNNTGQSTPYSGSQAVAIDAGRDHTCILLFSGQVRCQGLDYFGQAVDYPFPDERVVPEGWVRNVLLSEAVSIRGASETTPGVQKVVLRVEGDRSGNYYRISIESGPYSTSFAPYTGGFPPGGFELAVVDVPPQVISQEGVTVTVVAYAEWDTTVSACGLYWARGCVVRMPFAPTNVNYARHGAGDTTLTFGVRVQDDAGEVRFTDAVKVPYAGSMGAVFPFVIDR